ncbi:sugar fermentation stimulation protein A [Roseibium hamelinense]|uniref:Sugar fermentation stimulation protein homolog n=1 Tax=Roseibium hamelinense TaxID=150831 RepID=A0A562TAR7_9HYPH|nr:DNA/RNA nuclease SfsA [Roseibium hamelinense]MTI45118.1 DNA/RNA nuclease SfsA [Roseibium hamelinense]TWI90523.1 sugar fermentation stimulation protein A [Roseibium hamelinense]
MKLPAPLVRGKLVKRYKRFLADIILDEDGSEVTAHCANPGSMMGLKEPGSAVWLSVSDNPKRKLKYSWEIIEADGALVGINTAHPNRLVEEALIAGQVPELAGFSKLRREVKYGKNSRIDILLEYDNAPQTYVEVKNVHLMRTAGLAEFPDSVTVRGAKHLDEMSEMVTQGHRAAMVFLVQRPDCFRLSLAGDIDPNYAAAFQRAVHAGVEAYAVGCDVTPEAITVNRLVPLDTQA